MGKPVILILILLFPTYVFAAPFLTSDPHPACGAVNQPECPVEVEVYEDDQAIARFAVRADYTWYYDLVGRGYSEHKYTAKYYDQWGRPSGMSEDPYILKSIPDFPKGLKTVPVEPTQ